MHVPNGSPVGALLKDGTSMAAEVCMGETLTIGTLAAIPIWQDGGVQLLVIMPLGPPAMRVKKSGRRQAGAFIVLPKERFSLEDYTSGETTYTIEAAPAVEVVTEQSGLCAFCRTPIPKRGIACLTDEVAGSLRGKPFCHSCAEAWGGLGAAVSKGEKESTG